MLKGVILGTIALTSVLTFSPAGLTLPTKKISSAVAQGLEGNGAMLQVWAGYDLTIDFLASGEKINFVRLGDPSRFVYSSDGKLCSQIGSPSDCKNQPANVLFIRQIKLLNFNHLLHSQSGNTQITVITEGKTGRKVFQFELHPSTGNPEYSTVIIQPENQRAAKFPKSPGSI